MALPLTLYIQCVSFYIKPDPKKTQKQKSYIVLAHRLSEIGKVMYLLLKNVRDHDFEGQTLIVQGL